MEADSILRDAGGGPVAWEDLFADGAPLRPFMGLLRRLAVTDGRVRPAGVRRAGRARGADHQRPCEWCPIAEYVLRAVLDVFQDADRWRAAAIARRRELHDYREVAGSTWLVVGLGSIGGGVVRRAVAFGARVIGCRRHPGPDDPTERTATLDHLLDVVGEADVVVLAAPAIPQTDRLVDDGFLRAMGPSDLDDTCHRAPTARPDHGGGGEGRRHARPVPGPGRPTGSSVTPPWQSLSMAVVTASDHGPAAGPTPPLRGAAARIVTWLREADATLARLGIDDVPVAFAPDVIDHLARVEKRVTAARVRLGRRVAQSGLPEACGDRDAAAFAARLSGSSVRRARAELRLAQRLERNSDVERAYADGRLTTEQAQVVTRAAEADPAATEQLLEVAELGSFGDLERLAARTERAARSEEDEVARERRLRERRYCRTWTPTDGGVRIDAHLTAVDGAKVLAALTNKTNELMAGSDDTVEHLRADALVALACGDRVRTELLVRADAGALVRGATEGHETCEIEGVGPVSVATARSLLGEAFLTLLVTDGADISTVTSTTRVIPTKVEKALIARDPVCVIPGCTAATGLQIDHWRLDFAKTGLTTLDNLCRLCAIHHQMKTDGTLVLGGGPGKWTVATPRRRWESRAGP